VIVDIGVIIKWKVLKLKPLIIGLFQEFMRPHSFLVVFSECKDSIKAPQKVLIQKDVKDTHLYF